MNTKKRTQCSSTEFNTNGTLNLCTSNLTESPQFVNIPCLPPCMPLLINGGLAAGSSSASDLLTAGASRPSLCMVNNLSVELYRVRLSKEGLPLKAKVMNEGMQLGDRLIDGMIVAGKNCLSAGSRDVRPPGFNFLLNFQPLSIVTLDESAGRRTKS